MCTVSEYNKIQTLGSLIVNANDFIAYFKIISMVLNLNHLKPLGILQAQGKVLNLVLGEGILFITRKKILELKSRGYRDGIKRKETR